MTRCLDERNVLRKKRVNVSLARRLTMEKRRRKLNNTLSFIEIAGRCCGEGGLRIVKIFEGRGKKVLILVGLYGVLNLFCG